MKAKELQNKNKSDLTKELEEKQLRLRDIRFGMAGTKAKNVKEYANIKKNIARIRTIIKDKN